MKALLISFLIAVALYIALPDPANLGKVRGDTIDGVTKEQVCVPGYAKSVRNVPESIKRAVYKRDRVDYPAPKGKYEVDHFIPLALSGSNDLKNLWLQPAEVYASSGVRIGFHEKDRVEFNLWRRVCNNEITLKQAINIIKNGWSDYYIKEIYNKFGVVENEEEFCEDGCP